MKSLQKERSGVLWKTEKGGFRRSRQRPSPLTRQFVLDSVNRFYPIRSSLRLLPPRSGPTAHPPRLGGEERGDRTAVVGESRPLQNRRVLTKVPVRFCFQRLRRQVRDSELPCLPIHPVGPSLGRCAMAEHAAPELPKRCHHCAGPLSKDMETSSWTVTPLVRDSFSMIGSAVGGTAGAFYAFNHAMPVVRRYIKGPMWMHFLVGAPPVIVFSSACAGLAGGTIPALAQLVSSSCHATMSSPSFARSASREDMHKSTGSSPL